MRQKPWDGAREEAGELVLKEEVESGSYRFYLRCTVCMGERSLHASECAWEIPGKLQENIKLNKTSARQ